jgi:hypothetical protein
LYENSGCDAYLRLVLHLDVPPGVDYDLFVYRATCAAMVSSSTNGTGQAENITVTEDDDAGADDSTDFFIEVRQSSGNVAGNWTLRMSGGTGSCY